MRYTAPMTRVLYDLCGADASLRFSPYCWRAKLALAHKDLAFSTVPVPFTGIGAIPNGARTVPVLDDGGRLVRDSFDIALHLDAAYPDRPPLFLGGEGGVAAARFLERWAAPALHIPISRIIMLRVHDALGPADRAYFRASREKRFGQSLEAFAARPEEATEELGRALEPARRTLEAHAFLGGASPLFSDYILFGTLMWLHVTLGRLPLGQGDTVADWFERCLDLHGGLARRAQRAA